MRAARRRACRRAATPPPGATPVYTEWEEPITSEPLDAPPTPTAPSSQVMRTIGVSPVEALVLPRMMAAILMMPLLAFWAMLTALLGGGYLVWLLHRRRVA